MWIKLFHLHYGLPIVVKVRLHMEDYVKCTDYNCIAKPTVDIYFVSDELF